MERLCYLQTQSTVSAFPVMTSVIKYVFTVVKAEDQTFYPSLLAAAFLHPSLPVLYLPLGE